MANALPLPLHCLAVAVILGVLGGCAKKNLPEMVVTAGSAHEFADFRVTLGERFGPDPLQPFDTAIQELKLAAMRQGVAGVEAREQQVLAAVNAKTVRAVEILGWQARRARILEETAEITKLLNRDQRMQKRAATPAAAQSAADRIKSEQDILARLQDDLAGTERRLTEWGVKPEPPGAEKLPESSANERAP